VAAEQVEGTNGTTSPSDLRSQILSSIPDDEAPVEAPAEKAEPEAEAEDTDETEAVEASSDDADESTEEESDEDETEESDEETVVDPKAAKGLDAVRRAEKRHREKMDADRAEFAAERQKHAESLSQLAEFQSLAKRAKYDPIPVLKALGLTEDDYATTARAIYAESKEGGADPKHKEAAARQLREREKEDKYTALERKQAELEAKLERKDREVAEQAEVSQFIADINSAAKAKLPLAAHLLEKDPEGANAGLVAAYERLAKTGKAPKPAAVAAEYDRYERARLTKLGIDPNTITKTKAAVAAKLGAKPVTNGKTVTAPNGALTKEQVLALIPDDADIH
jgi:hypothetical protein